MTDAMQGKEMKRRWSDFVFCSTKTYSFLRKFCRVSGGFSQEDISFFGIIIGYSQPDTLSEDFNAPDLCWCRRIFRRAALKEAQS